MLRKNNKIKRKVFDFVFKNGKIHNSKNITLRLKHTKNWNEFNIAFVVPKKVNKSAVARNLIKRRGYYVIKKHIKSIKKPFIGIFVIKKSSKNLKFKDFEDEIIFLLKKENLI